MSPRAAWRLESLGFSEVYDYKEGKLDWLAAGLPTEGTNATKPRAGDVARKDVPTCSLSEKIGSVAKKVAAAGWNACVVVNEEQVVLGLLREAQLAEDPDQLVEAIMRPGPSTFRPHVSIQEMAHYMLHHDLPSSPITTSDGRLVGRLKVEDAARVAREQHGSGEAEAP